MQKDKKTLLGLLNSSELTRNELEAFQSMWDQIARGKALTHKQRAWAERVYYKLGLDRKEPPTASGPKKVLLTSADKAWLKEYCGPRADKPLKPPGR